MLSSSVKQKSGAACRPCWAAGYCGLLLGAPVVLYEGIEYVLPGLTKDERKFLAWQMAPPSLLCSNFS